MKFAVDKVIHRIYWDPETTDPKMPVDWDAQDVAVNGSWNIDSVRRFAGVGDDFTAIYPSVVDVNDLHPKIFDKDDGWLEEFQHRSRRGYPPIVIVRTTTGTIRMLDGNHRVTFAQMQGYETIGAWVVDKLLQKHLDRRNAVLG